MTDLRKAAEMVLDELEHFNKTSKEAYLYDFTNEIAALRQALAQPEQEPVAWLEYDDEGYLFLSGKRKGAFPVFIAPSSKPFVFLTKEDMPSGDHPMYDTKEFYAGMAWAQTKLKEKNT